MEFPPVWLDERDFDDIKVMISIQNEYEYCATRASKSMIVTFNNNVVKNINGWFTMTSRVTRSVHSLLLTLTHMYRYV